MRIELTTKAWEALVLPLNYARIILLPLATHTSYAVAFVYSNILRGFVKWFWKCKYFFMNDQTSSSTNK